MALFGRDRLPARSTLSRFLAALTQEPVEALRTLFLDDLLARPLARGAHRRAVGSSRQPLARLRCGWHARGRPPTRLATDGRSACAPAALASALCAWLHRAQARGSRAHPHHRFAGPYPTNGSAPLAIAGNGDTGQSCAGRWRPSNATSSAPPSHQNAPSCGWMGNMAPEPSSPIWLDCAYVMRGKDYSSSTEPRSRLACTCPQISIQPPGKPDGAQPLRLS